MSASPTLTIRNGTIVDGSGGDPFQADIAITGGRISAIGDALPHSTQEIDARDRLVTPGFVDVHTHYDAQVTWGSQLSPSSWNGVTTVLLGNCGVGFAPCHENQRDMLVKLMEGVEDIPEVVLTEGLPWTWNTFPEFLDVLGARQYDVDVATQVPHAALRVYVMGQRGADREPATEADRQRMAELTEQGIRAGALGFSTSRTLNHRTLDGKHIPTLRAVEAELTAIARGMRSAGAGWMQIVSDFEDQDKEFGLFRRLAEASGRPVTMTLLQSDTRPDGWRALLDQIEAANAAGLRITGQVRSRPTSVLLGFELSQNPFMGRASYKKIAHLPFPERLRQLHDPAFRAALLSEPFEGGGRALRVQRWDNLFPLGDPPNYEPSLDNSIAARAAREYRSPDEVAYDLLMERDGKAILYLPVTNFAAGNLDAVREMIAHPDTLLGLGDGGAHVGIMCDATATSYTLTHWTRERGRGELFPVAWAVKRLSHDNAAAIGLNDRGLLRVGMKADLNVIDYDRLALRSPEIVYDLPAGGKRLVQRTEGFDATIVSGAVVYRNGEPTGALPADSSAARRQLESIEKGNMEMGPELVDYLLYEPEESGILWIKFNRPERMNALVGTAEENGTVAKVGEYMRAGDDDPNVRVIVLTGVGRGFCSGANLGSRASADLTGPNFPGNRGTHDGPDAARQHFYHGFTALHRDISLIRKPTVAMINGPAVGSGMDMALHCDIRIGCERTRFIGYHNAGQIIENGGSYYLPKMVGLGRALEFAYTGELNAERAYAWGMLNHLVPSDELEATTRALCEKMMGIPPLVQWVSKRVMRAALDSTLETTMVLTSNAGGILQNSEDATEARRAFVEKRKGKFKGR